MNKIVLASAAIFICAIAFAQQMQVKQPNFATFHKQEKKIPPLLDKMSSPEAKQHPEYGILPFNSQCRECVELIDKRTMDSRFFVDPKNAGHTWSQQSYFPLHYKSDSNDVWHTIDQRLRPDANNPGVYMAKNQPVPTTLDLNKKNVSLDLGELQFSSDNNLTMYFFEEGKAYTQTQKGDYTHLTVGEEGMTAYNMWDGIDMRQTFEVGRIETNYIINSPLSIPVSDKGYMVIEDHFSIPDGYTFEELNPNPYEKYYRDDYVLKNKKGEGLMYYEKPIYTDANHFGMPGYYNLIREGNNYTLQTMVPVTWLKNPNNVYPIVIDPALEGSTKVGNYRSTHDPSASEGFTTDTVGLGYCDYHMTVRVPGKSSLVQAFVQVEWQLTFDNTCQAAPPHPTPECTYQQVYQVVVCDSCNTQEQIICSQAPAGIYVGTCTTDPDLVPGADSIPIITNPPFLSCYAAQCPDYNIPVTLRNSETACDENCGYACARGNFWEVTIEAQQVEGSITQNQNTVCAGRPIVDTVHAIYGVPPYTYQWFYGNDTSTSTNGDSTLTVHPENSIAVYCLVSDACGVLATSNELFDNVVPAPPANAGPDQYLCAGGAITLGGNPTTSANSNVFWTASNPTALSWLSSDTADNPIATIPEGTIDTFFYVVTATNLQCSRADTVNIFSGSGTVPVIRMSGDSLISSYTIGNQWYLNDSIREGDTSQVIIDTVPGTYTVRVSSDGCVTGLSLPVTITGIDNVSGMVNSLNISPNPSNGNFVLKFVSSQNYAAASMSIYNNAGQLMDSRNVPIVAGANSYTFQTGERLAAGIYYLYINAGSKGFKQRFVVE